MADVYQQVTNEETEEITYELVEPDNVLEHIGDDVVRTSPLVTSVTEESIKRRKAIKVLKTEITGLREALDTAQGSDDLTDDDNNEETPPVVPDPPTDEQLNFGSREELMAFVTTQLSEQSVRETAERATVVAELDALAEEHKLSKEDRVVLNTASDPKVLAEYLGRIRVSFGDVPGGELQPADDMPSLMGSVNKILGLDD